MSTAWALISLLIRGRRKRVGLRVRVLIREGFGDYFLRLTETGAPSVVVSKGRTGSLHLGPCIRALCAPHVVIFPSVISRGTPHQPARETSINEGRKLNRI
jgi:hypothetical protein